MATKLEISLYNGSHNLVIGTLVIAQDLSESEVAEIANEAGGLSDLCAMATECNVPVNYDWTGDEVYEIVED